jgi:DNA topoisomerase-1
MAVDRGDTFEVCVDRDCESLDARVKARFDRDWDCPECDGDLRVLRRGGLIAGCEHYPDCDTGFSFPTGLVVDDCDCGLPVFETESGRRCLDSGCGEQKRAKAGETTP